MIFRSNFFFFFFAQTLMRRSIVNLIALCLFLILDTVENKHERVSILNVLIEKSISAIPRQWIFWASSETKLWAVMI